MSTKTILIAHRTSSVRDRFAVALADAQHRFVMAGTDAEARRAASTAELSLALVDLGLADDGLELVRALREAAGDALPLMIFSGTVRSAADVPTLVTMRAGFINEHASTPQILPALAPHLFPDSFNRRASARVAVSVPVSFRSGKAISGAVTLDIGSGGIGIRTMDPLLKDSQVEVRFRLPGVPNELQATGRVAWSDRRVGMGVEFIDISRTDADALAGFVQGSQA